MTEDLIERMNTMAMEEDEPEGIEFSDLFGNTTIHDIELVPNEHGMFNNDDSNISDGDFMINEKAMDDKMAAEEELDLAEETDDDTFHDTLEDSDSDTENLEVDDSYSDTEDPEVDDSDYNTENQEVQRPLVVGNPELVHQQRNTNTTDDEIMDENLEENVEKEDNTDVEDIMDATVDSRKDNRICYLIAPYNEPDTYLDKIEGLVPYASDIVLNMIQDYSDMEPKVDPKSILIASKFTPQYFYTKGFKIFKAAGYDATKQELDENLIGRCCVETLCYQWLRWRTQLKKKALNYFMFLKRKRGGKIKARDCAN